MTQNSTLATSLRTIISKMNKQLRKHMQTVDNLSITAVTTLSYLYHEESLYPSELANLVKVKTQSMSEVLTHLRSLNLINKTASTTDKRKTAISLTAHGRLQVEKTRYERDEWLTSAIAQTLSSRDKKVLQEAITLLDKLSDSK